MIKTSKKLKIAFDVDNTLVCYEKIKSLISHIDNKNLEKKHDSVEELREYQKDYNNFTFKKTNLLAEFLHNLKSMGAELIVLSSRPAKKFFEKFTRWQLERAGFEFPNIILGCIKKGEYCSLNEVDILIDDNFHHCTSFYHSNPNGKVFHFTENQCREDDERFQTLSTFEELIFELQNYINFSNNKHPLKDYTELEK